MSEYTPTTQQVENGFAHEPEYEYHNPIGYGSHVQANRRGFKRWLAEVERAAAEKGWDEGYEHNCDLSDGPADKSYSNPYRQNEGE